MAFFGKPGDGLARQPKVDDVGVGELGRGAQGGLDQRRPAPVISDAVAEERNARVGRLKRRGGEGKKQRE